MEFFDLHRIQVGCCLLSFLLLFIFFLIILVQSPSQEQIESIGVIDTLTEELSLNPIQDILIIDENSKCPLDMESQALWRWPGTSTGRFVDGRVKKNQYGQKNQMGEIIKHTASFNLKIWMHKKFCVKRLSSNFTQNQNCEDNYKECAITQLELKSSANHKFNSQTDQQLSENLILIKTKKSYSYKLINNINVVPYGKPCISKGAYDVEYRNRYPLLHVEFQCGRYGYKTDYKFLYQINFLEFLKQNDFDYNQLLPNFEKYNDDTTAKLISQLQPQRNENRANCVILPQYKSQKQLRRFATISNSLGMKSFWFQFLFGILSTVFPMYYVRKYQKSFARSLGMGLIVVIFSEFYLILLILGLTMLSHGKSIDKLAVPLQYEQLFTQNCFYNEVYNEAYSDFNSVQEQSQTILTIRPFVVIVLVLRIIVTIFVEIRILLLEQEAEKYENFEGRELINLNQLE